MRERVLSGMQSSGMLHIGNLVGALQNWVRLVDSYDCFYFIADWHALTTNYAKPEMIKASSEDLILNFLAAGIDPERCTIFQQSRVPAHAELHLLLGMITPLGWLERVPSYKEKKTVITDRDMNTYGFLGYPLLQSADILLYRPKYVPVGIDQLPHLEITREIARRYQFLYGGDTLVEPEGLLTTFSKVPGVDGQKMSKTYGNAIYLCDPADVVDKKIKTMMTDPARKRKTDPGDPKLCPVFDLHRIFSTEPEREEITKGCTSAGIGCIDCKKVLIGHVLSVLTPIWEKRAELLHNPDEIREILEAGNSKAVKAANETMERVREDMRLNLSLFY